MLAISVSHNALDSTKTKEELVQNEAINICASFKWADFFVSMVLHQFFQVQFNVITKTLGLY